MQACVLHGIGDLRTERVPDPEPGPHETIVRVGACGVCGSDLPRIFQKGTYRFPTIPGHELAGTVVDVGSEVDGSLLNRTVAVFPLIPCRACMMCERGEYVLCENYNYIGSRCDGGFAEFVRVPAWNLVPLPEGITIEEGAMTEPVSVALHALRRAKPAVGDAVLILGAGPIGLLLAMWARAWGAGRVMVVDIDERRLGFADELGFSDGFNPTRGLLQEWVRNRTHGGADIVVEASGSSAALDGGLPCARPFGSVVLLGNPAGEMRMSQDAYWSILRRELNVYGTWNSTYRPAGQDDWKLSLESMANGRIDVKPLITHRVGLDGLWDALVMLRDRTQFANKVMFVDQN